MTTGTWTWCPSCHRRVKIQMDLRVIELHPALVVNAMALKIAASHTPECEAAYAARKVTA